MKSLGGLGVIAYVVYDVSGRAETILNGINTIKFHRARASVMSLKRRSGSPLGGVHNGRINGGRPELEGQNGGNGRYQVPWTASTRQCAARTVAVPVDETIAVRMRPVFAVLTSCTALQSPPSVGAGLPPLDCSLL